MALLLVSAGLTACSPPPPRDPGCTPPPREKELLTAYRSDPVFSVRPEGAKPSGDVKVSQACIVQNREETTSTRADRYFTGTFDVDDLRAAYDEVAVNAGWKPSPWSGTPPPRYAVLEYCKPVLDVTSWSPCSGRPLGRGAGSSRPEPPRVSRRRRP